MGWVLCCHRYRKDIAVAGHFEFPPWGQFRGKSKCKCSKKGPLSQTALCLSSLTVSGAIFFLLVRKVSVEMPVSEKLTHTEIFVLFRTGHGYCLFTPTFPQWWKTKWRLLHVTSLGDNLVRLW